MYDPLKIFIVDNHLNSYRFSDFLAINQGRSKDIHFTKKIDKKLGLPYNNCSLASEYSQDYCIDKCVGEKVIQEFNCSLPGFYQKEIEECHYNSIPFQLRIKIFEFEMPQKLD